ncbi:MAG TPA: membrane protein insertion efficiency factor YidD [Candidatus Limnocylindria bacterium]|jgi:putative membrane protein insertion efficiency factor|nr:membrane protein insertion efficiency factor YidD [Candidatus Limnocylindria bacterium]
MALRIALMLLRLYRTLLSPMLVMTGGPGMGCRFEPTCSRYAEEAFRLHGVVRGSRLTAHRLCRCHPWGGAGLDLVPPANAVGHND